MYPAERVCPGSGSPPLLRGRDWARSLTRGREPTVCVSVVELEPSRVDVGVREVATDENATVSRVDEDSLPPAS